jgi:protein-disulfide isomerase
MHTFAFQAALAGRCVARIVPDHFWLFHDAVFAADSGFVPRNIHKLALAAGLSADRFSTCVRDSAISTLIEQGIAEAQALGLQATPSFVIGTASQDSVRGLVVQGALPEAVFARVIDSLLTKQ